MDKQTQGKALDVAIAGAGVAGPALAIALKQSLGGGFSVTVFDPVLSREPAKDDRVVAIAGGARRLFEAIGVWTPSCTPPCGKPFSSFPKTKRASRSGTWWRTAP